MNIEQYLEDLVKKYVKSNRNLNETIIKELKKTILSFEHKKINQIVTFGSSIKGTNIRENPKVKLLISMKEKDKRSTEEITTWFYNYLQTPNNEIVRKGNQLNFNYKGIDFNIFIAKKKDKTYNYHVMQNLNLSKEVVSNFNIHTFNVVDSNFQKEIILMKLWREKHNLNFPTMYLELVVIDVLRKCKKKNLFSRIIRILDFLRKDFIQEKFYDPSNTNNVISDYISLEEKMKIQTMAKLSLTEEYITDIVS
ncbi:MAG: hypothetical protein ACK5B9_15450 [Flavobacteriia bacterium]|jgi:hypothetical protein